MGLGTRLGLTPLMDYRHAKSGPKCGPFQDQFWHIEGGLVLATKTCPVGPLVPVKNSPGAFLATEYQLSHDRTTDTLSMIALRVIQHWNQLKNPAFIRPIFNTHTISVSSV